MDIEAMIPGQDIIVKCKGVSFTIAREVVDVLSYEGVEILNLRLRSGEKPNK